MKMESLRRIYGIAEPVRHGMEMKIVREGQWKPAALGGNTGGSIHEDILAFGGRETEIGWEDIFHGMFLSVLLIITNMAVLKLHVCVLLFQKTLCDSQLMIYIGDELREPPTFHDEMEQRLKMN